MCRRSEPLKLSFECPNRGHGLQIRPQGGVHVGRTVALQVGDADADTDNAEEGIVSHLEDPAQDGQKMLASALPCSERRDDDLLTQAERRSHHSAAQRGEVVLVGAPDLLDQSVEPQTSQHP